MAFTNPKENLAKLGLASGMTVADFGAGGGMQSLLAAKEVGDGKVYAIDVQKGLLSKIQSDAQTQGITNIEIIWADLEKKDGSNLENNSVDAVIATNILFLVEDKKAFVSEIRRVLRPSGKALIVDWSDSFGGLGPQPEHVLLEGEAQRLFKNSGFVIENEFSSAGEHHYGFIVKKNNE